MFTRQVCQLQRVILFPEFLVNIFPLIDLILFPDILIHSILIDYFFVHVRLKPIPTILLSLFINIFILNDHIIRSNLFIREFCPNFSWTLRTLLPWMTHRTTVLACTLAVGSCLETFDSPAVPLGYLRFRLKWWRVYLLTLSFIVLRIPWHFLYVLWRVLHFLMFPLKNYRYCYWKYSLLIFSLWIII